MWEPDSDGLLRQELAAVIGQAARLAAGGGDEAGDDARAVGRGIARLCGMDLPRLQQYLDRGAAAAGADGSVAALAAALLLRAAAELGEVYAVTDAEGARVYTESGNLAPICDGSGVTPAVLFFIGRGAAESFGRDVSSRIGVALRAYPVRGR